MYNIHLSTLLFCPGDNHYLFNVYVFLTGKKREKTGKYKIKIKKVEEGKKKKKKKKKKRGGGGGVVFQRDCIKMKSFE